ncbi:hypothetical protein K503DRAFT_767435 [Rhizopogon vinicolor AM-OR11-026]|uniref:CBM1 domain-containing protein n=1 Tax=Rhizopogon vinicolor AM-OR11-026 TaxID=1314800 RepID=A0A1B7NA20_9AGAM|nr:hypothetical protein K503DRAFT_767435 [Rhizopogon vinicolor AM-OR11-026]
MRFSFLLSIAALTTSMSVTACSGYLGPCNDFAYAPECCDGCYCDCHIPTLTKV